jgi:hypothetical protein
MKAKDSLLTQINTVMKQFKTGVSSLKLRKVSFSYQYYTKNYVVTYNIFLFMVSVNFFGTHLTITITRTNIIKAAVIPPGSIQRYF